MSARVKARVRKVNFKETFPCDEGGAPPDRQLRLVAGGDGSASAGLAERGFYSLSGCREASPLLQCSVGRARADARLDGSSRVKVGSSPSQVRRVEENRSA